MLGLSFSEMTCSLKKAIEGTCPNSDRSLQEQGLGLDQLGPGPHSAQSHRSTTELPDSGSAQPAEEIKLGLCTPRKPGRAVPQGLSGECPVTVQVISFIEMGFRRQPLRVGRDVRELKHRSLGL